MWLENNCADSDILSMNIVLISSHIFSSYIIDFYQEFPNLYISPLCRSSN